MLEQILDPSREVAPPYFLYVAETVDDRMLVGSIAAESDAALTIQRADGGTDVVLRERIESLRTLGLSLMPNGLEKGIPPQAMADLIALLRR